METIIEMAVFILGMAFFLVGIVMVLVACTSILARRADQDRDKWVPVGERLPEDRQDVLTYWAAKGHIQLQTFYDDYANIGAWWMHGWQNLAVEDGDVTHWMPLPAPP